MDTQYDLFPELQSEIGAYCAGRGLVHLQEWVAEHFDLVLQLGNEKEQRLIKFLQGSFIEIAEEITNENEFKQELVNLKAELFPHTSPTFCSSNSSNESFSLKLSTSTQNLDFTFQLA
jgi:hypothetical protein